MSTRCTIDYNDPTAKVDDPSLPAFHLFSDLYDDNEDGRSPVYLQISGVEFEASPNQVTVRIPWALWERLKAGRTKQ